jgi:hypothetical protein
VLVPLPDHPAPAGPLAVRYLAYELDRPRAGRLGRIRVELENAGTGTWYAVGPASMRVGYHWYDRFGNVLVWEGLRALLPGPVGPGERVALDVPIAVPMPPGRYRLAIDLVDEGRHWFAELGNTPLELEVEVEGLLERRELAVRIGEGSPEAVEETRRALAAQEEPVSEDGEAIAFLAAGCLPAPDWSRRVLDAHDEGHAAVAGSIEVLGSLLTRRFAARELEPWQPGFGRAPSWRHPLLCPSLLVGLVDRAPWTDPVAGLPALDPAGLVEPWLCDGRIRVAVPATALRRADRRRA